MKVYNKHNYRITNFVGRCYIWSWIFSFKHTKSKNSPFNQANRSLLHLNTSAT